MMVTLMLPAMSQLHTVGLHQVIVSAYIVGTISITVVLLLLCVIFLTYMCCPRLCSHSGWLLLKCSAIGIGFNGASY